MGPPESVQQPLDAVVGQRLLLDVVLEHLPVLGEEGSAGVFKKRPFYEQ